MLVCVLAVLAVGVPGIVAAIGDLSESQRLEALGRLNARSVALAHSLADERDEMALFVAGGRSTAGGTGGVTEDQRARVDRQADDVSAFAADVDADDDPAAARQTSRIGKLLAGLPELRQSALSGPGSARTTFDGYSELVDALNGLSATIATRLPGRAADEDTAALPALTRAVDRATAQRGLLLVALGAGGPQSGTVRAAQQAVVGERAALADFDAAASRAGADRYAETVTGKETDDAEALVARLTDGGALTGGDLRVQPDDLKSSLTARIDRMRSVESSLAADSAARLRDMRDDDVVALEIRAGLTGVAALLVLGLTVTVSRSVVRPLAGLHRAARDLNGRLLSELDRTDHEVTDPGPVTPVGQDEFRDVATALGALQERAVRLHRERASVTDDRTALTALRDSLTAERDRLLGRERELLEERDTLQVNLHNTFVNLSMRTLTLVERQLALIERLEDREQDPDQLESLFRLDHLATRMRRNGENLLVLAGVDTGSSYRKPVPLLDVMRAAISEIERYERVQIQFLPRVLVAGRSCDDISHLVAELLENATAFSPPQAEVEVSGWVLENGEVMLSVEDRGIGIPADRLAELNTQLAAPEPDEDTVSRSMGLFVVGRLARRYGVRVQLREVRRGGGVTAVVILPRALVVADRPGPEPESAESVLPGQRTRPAVPSPDRAPDDTASGASAPSRPGAHGPAGGADDDPADVLDPEPEPFAGTHPDPGADLAEDTLTGLAAADSSHSAPRGTSRRLDHVLQGTPPAPPGDPGSALPPSLTAGEEPPDGRPSGPAPATAPPAARRTTPEHTESGRARPEHTRPDDATAPAGPVRPKDSGEAEPPPRTVPGPRTDTAPGQEAPDVPLLTSAGLPKRVPRPGGLPGAPAGPPSPNRRDAVTGERDPDGAAGTDGPGGTGGAGAVDAAELRRKLGGFQQGLREGRREAEALVPPPPQARIARARAQAQAHAPSAPSTPEDGEARG